MTERGMVTGVSGKLVTVRLRMADGCAGCLNEACKTGGREIQGYNREDIAVAEGDEIELNIEGKASLIGSFWLLGLPLALLGAGYAAGRAAWAGSGEGPAVLLGLGALVIGMLVGILVQKRRKLDSLPSLLRKVEAKSGEDEADFREGSSEYAEAISSE